MIIRRYLARELLSTTSAVTSVLLIVVMSGRFVRYLAEAAAGKLDPTVLLSIMFYRIPGFLELILPLGFMIAILMVYGRLYTDQEMSALFSAGVSQDRILTYTLLPAALISIFVGFCSLWLTPLGLTEAERVLEQQKQRGGLAALVPGKFQLSRSGNVVNYFEDLGKDRQLENVFIATTDASGSTGPVTITADSAQQIQHDEYQHLYLLVTRGERYQGYPGSVNYRTTQFEALGQRLDQPETNIIPSESVDTMPTRKLLNMEKSDAYAALQWRFSSPLITLIVAIIGFSMSYTTPRRGRYAMLFPSIIVYMTYFVSLNAARTAIEDRGLSPGLGLWLVHGLFLVAAVLLFLIRSGQFTIWSTIKNMIEKRTTVN